MIIKYIFLGGRRREILVDHTFNRYQVLESELDKQFCDEDLVIQMRLYADYKKLKNKLFTSARRYTEFNGI